MRLRLTAGTAIGILIVVASLLLLLGELGLLSGAALWDWFPALFVLLGLWVLVSSRLRNLVFPLAVVLVAGAYLLRNVGVITEQQFGTWWPLIPLILGVAIILRRSRPRRRVPEASGNRLDVVAAFGGQERRVTSKGFEGGDIVAAFGGVEVDLRDAAVRDGPAALDVVAIFGGVDLRVPKEWDVRLDVVPVFGGASDERSRSPSPAGRPTLVVSGVAIFGGVSVKD